MFRIGIIGAGNRSLALIAGIEENDGMELTAIADACAESCKRALEAAPPQTQYCQNAQSLLARGDVDGVLLATPNDTHLPLGKLVIDSGKPLYLEKPMGVSAAQCDELIAYAAQKNAKVMVGMQLRYSDVYSKMKALCDQGLIGEVRLLLFRALRGPFRPGVGGWRMQAARSGGTILEVSVHQLDLFNWFAQSRLQSVVAFGGRDAIYQNEQLLDNVILTAQYENGVKASLQAAVFAPQGADDTGLCVVGTHGTMYHTGNEIIVKFQKGDMLRYTTTGYKHMDAHALAGFMRYALEDEAPLTTLAAGRDAVALGLLAERSIQTGHVETVVLMSRKKD